MVKNGKITIADHHNNFMSVYEIEGGNPICISQYVLNLFGVENPKRGKIYDYCTLRVRLLEDFIENENKFWYAEVIYGSPS